MPRIIFQSIVCMRHPRPSAMQTLIKNCEEGLAVAIRHYGWAPLTRVYTLCRTIAKARLPHFLSSSELMVGITAVIRTITTSVRLNRGFSQNDLQLLNRENFRKLFKSRIEIMTGKRRLTEDKHA